MYWTCCDRLLRSPCEQSTPAACYRRQLLVADPLTYCWWLKSCTWYVWNLVNNWVQAVSIKLVQVLSYQQWQLLDVSRHKCLFANKHVKCLNCWIQWEMVNFGYWSQLSNCFCQSSDGVDWCLLRCIWGGENLWVFFRERPTGKVVVTFFRGIPCMAIRKWPKLRVYIRLALAVTSLKRVSFLVVTILPTSYFRLLSPK